MGLPTTRRLLFVLLLLLTFIWSNHAQRRQQRIRNRVCTPTQFKCKNGECIEGEKYCDSVADCRDSSDEHKCPRCRTNEFECADGNCISGSGRCDGRFDCYDYSDEHNCNVTTCGGDQFRCLDGTCLSIVQRCNGIPECDNGEDENQCDRKCTPTQFKCVTGNKCIEGVYRCDGHPDCPDRSDEDCATTSANETITHSSPPTNASWPTERPPTRYCDLRSEMRCDDGGCVPLRRKCDNIFDCQDGSDERGCGICTPAEWKCASGECLPENQRCDGVQHCTDGSDESGCECPVGKRPCDNGVCIDKTFFCDNRPDCLDQSDERDCSDNDGDEGQYPEECRHDEFTCGDGSCVPRTAFCDGRTDCPQAEDEINCQPRCSRDQFQCSNGDCIRGDQVCNGYIDCDDGSDETANCHETTSAGSRCPSGQFQCVSDESCVPQFSVCNGIADCRDSSDEDNCDTKEYPEECSPEEWQCDSGDCIYHQQRCDRRVDCPHDDSDEWDCNYNVTERNESRCSSHEWRCESGYCLPIDRRCDKRIDCPTDMSDELGCNYKTWFPTEAFGLNLKTYPNEQVIKESREVVFQCRDEGPLRARVRWLRENDVPLPPGSRDLNGRLEIPNIKLEHAGIYICEAVEYPPSAQGRRVTVSLEVEKYEEPLTRPVETCRYDEATCSNRECIPKSYVCNGKIDCTDGSDESRCSPHGCEPNQFRCNNTQCVTKTWRCDGEIDCADRSDEENCAPLPPGSPCRYNEFSCSTGKQCIPKNYQCDMERDCFDGSDEIGCSPAFIVKPPTSMVFLEPGDTFEVTCTAIGVPIPEISWRHNWRHVPSKCQSVSINGTGTLTCPDVQREDEGAYSCEALNQYGFILAVPDAKLFLKPPPQICPKGTFNSEAKSVNECISCFCFGVATECRSANLFIYQIPPPFDRHKIVSVETIPEIRIHSGDIDNEISEIRPIDRNGIQLFESFGNNLNEYDLPYFSLPENYHGNQLKSYGGYLRYNVRYSGNGVPNNASSVILSGNDYLLVHKGRYFNPDQEIEHSVRFFYGDWYKVQGRNEILASREEIMMALANVDNILIKAKYDNSPQLDIRITNIVMDTADVRNTELGSASFVEDCQCPTGYTGLSCENCAPGYLRRETGPWLGQCYRDEPPCSAGYYGDPPRNIPCMICPCPLTNPSNQFARTCHLGSDGLPTCDCPAGYVGRRCEQCAIGYQGNPLISGNMCVLIQQCDLDGSLSPNADPYTGQCRCKQYATGLTCNQCKANTFNLASSNQFGCIGCFCMGITTRCVSSNWYRNEIHVSFTNSIRDFSLTESQSPDALSPIVNGIRLDTISREIVYNDFPNRGNNDVYYWQLPSIFLGNQITSYGGNLKYTLRYVPSPGGQSSRNNAADVELISANDIILLHYSGDTPESNTRQTFKVPLLEQYWQRNDGTQADREHLLMALADVHAIRIKATYTTHTDEAAISSVSLDTAERYNTGMTRAVEVEECSCPVGYKGLSCEDCDVGYTRAIEGLYLGICEPCNCNGHSNQCDPETGVCENCAHHTTGENCEVCEPGYVGDATRGTPHDCQTNILPTHWPQCTCNEAGSRSTKCISGRCECKRNVEGPECNRCRPSTFGLSIDNMDGCTECYCSGVTDQCHESPLYIQQIPIWIYDSHHGFTLTDSTRRDVIDDGFDLNVAMNEIGYRYPDGRSRRLFWSLPPVFTGNKIKSYGGNLTLTQHITALPGAKSYKDQDILLIGNGITLFWTNPRDVQPDIPLTYSVLLKESEWRRWVTEGPRSVSRTDLMTVLSNLEAILVRASHSERMTSTYISDISLDTAVETGNRRAIQVEACRCPAGYTGTSCETCARGYYRDTNDRMLSVLGSCNSCPCNKKEESCEIGRSGHVKCHCLPGYTGQYCQEILDHTETPTPTLVTPPRITVFVQESEIQLVQIGSTVKYHCSGRSMDSDSLYITWEKENGQLPTGRSIDDNHGLLIITDVKISDSGIYVCQVSDGVNIGNKKVTLSVGAGNPVEPKVVITPSSLRVIEGEPVEFLCEASGNPLPQVEWIRVHGNMSPEAIFYNGVWKLPGASKNDAAEYKCIARNNVGIDEKTTILYVQDNPDKPPTQGIPPIITPPEWIGTIMDVVRVVCTPSQRANVTWSRAGGLPLPYTASQRDGILTIVNPTPNDSGLYACTATSYRGTETSATAIITIKSRREPIVKVEPDRQKISQGSYTEIRCITNGESGLQIKWNKHSEPMSPNVQQIGDTLRITKARVSDRGVYICRVIGLTGSTEASAIVEVEPREAPLLELHPQETLTVIFGGSADLQCRVKAGIPTPDTDWSRQDGRPFPPNIEKLPGGLLRLLNITINDGGSYVCTARNEVGSTSILAHIEVQSMPVITITPKTGILPVKLGQKIRLVCTAVGHPQPNVAWSKHINGLALYDSYGKTADTPLSAVYEIMFVSPRDEGSYTCQASNNVGIAEERIQIRIEEDNDIDYPPCRGDMPCTNGSSIDTSPQTKGISISENIPRIPNGGKVEMRCHVVGPGENHIYLDWKRSDHRSLPVGSTVHNGILTIPKVDVSAAGEYICLGLDPAGNVLFRSKSHLEVISLPTIELYPMRQTVSPGKNPSIICSAIGDKPMNIEWEAIGRPLPRSVTRDRGILQFHGITYSDAGKYVCKATNDAGTAEAVAEVLVNDHSYDEAIVRATQRDVVTNVGDSVRLRCEVQNHDMIQWSREGQALPSNARIEEDYIELIQVEPRDSGTYICQIRNSHGVSSDYIYLRVLPPALPVLSVKASQDPINIGDTVDIRCACSGTRNPRYQWSRPNHSNLPSNAQEYGDVLRLTNVVVSDSGIYRCTADTPEGNLQEDFNLVVHGGHNDAPAIETKFAPYGSSLEMDCHADLDPPIEFHWNKLGGFLPRDAQISENKLKLIEVKAEDAGTYICTADNGHINREVPTVLVVTGVVPNFSQAPESYIALPPLPDSYLKFNIEISFKPEKYDGIILYNDELNMKNGDFIILVLVGGYPQFRFNLGSGPAVIKADKKVSLGEWHTIKLQRTRKEGTMLVDSEGPYTGVAVGRRQGLDLTEPLYIGGIPNYTIINHQIEVKNTGFIGCISRLVIGKKEIDLIGDQTDSVGITTCETCAENPCNNAGVCQEATTKNGYTCLCRAGYSGKHCDHVGQSCYPGACGEGKCVSKEIGFDCYCPPGKTGVRCEHSKQIYEPAFNNNKAFIAHETPKALRRKRKSMTTSHSLSRLFDPQVRKHRSRPHHDNNPHHTKHY